LRHDPEILDCFDVLPELRRKANYDGEMAITAGFVNIPGGLPSDGRLDRRVDITRRETYARRSCAIANVGVIAYTAAGFDFLRQNLSAKRVEQFFKTGSKAKIQPRHADKLKLQLFALDNAKSKEDMNASGWRLHPLHGNLENHWSVEVSGNWRLTFTFEGEDAVLVDYQDYH